MHSAESSLASRPHWLGLTGVLKQISRVRGCWKSGGAGCWQEPHHNGARYQRPPPSVETAANEIRQDSLVLTQLLPDGKLTQAQGIARLTGVSVRVRGDTEGLLAVRVAFDPRCVAEVGRDAVALEAAVEDALELDADVDAHGDDDGEEQQGAAEQVMSNHVEGREG
jgi:hypothetical protein